MKQSLNDAELSFAYKNVFVIYSQSQFRIIFKLEGLVIHNRSSLQVGTQRLSVPLLVRCLWYGPSLGLQ